MASYLNQLMQYVENETGLPHKYGFHNVAHKDRPINSIVWVRSIPDTKVSSGFSKSFPSQDSRTAIISKDMVVDIHIRAIDEDTCDAMLDATIQALDDSSIGDYMKLQSVIPNQKNDDITSAFYLQVFRLTIPQNIYREADIKAKMQGFVLANNAINDSDGWITLKT